MGTNKTVTTPADTTPEHRTSESPPILNSGDAEMSEIEVYKTRMKPLILSEADTGKTGNRKTGKVAHAA